MTPLPATATEPKEETGSPKPEIGPPKPPAKVVLNDLGIRLIGIPCFGIVIPNLTGLFGPLGPASLIYWLGYPWFVLLSGFIWQGNRFFLVQQRRHYDWFRHPWRKVTLLLFANVFYTAPLTVAWLWAWYQAAAFGPADWQVIRVVTLANVICVIFITHVYETVYLIQQREDDLLAVARLDRARAEAELAALRSQVDPHFLFNSLNTLTHLIPVDPARALEFTEGLADIYRYVLSNRQRDLVPPADELAFAQAYVGLLRLRFGDAVSLHCDLDGGADSLLVPAVSLQVLLENAVKHNVFDRRLPLEIRVQGTGDHLRVENPLRPRPEPPRPSQVGLKNLDERCRRVAGRALEVRTEGGVFSVTLPVLKTSA